MIIFKYTIKLLDPLFYSREGLAGAITPKYLHATAINHAVVYALGKEINQPYIISEENGGRNTPRYKNSFIKDLGFYLTPARIKGNVNYISETVKGDSDGFLVRGYGSSTGKAEVLKSSQLFSIAPETEFEGYIIVDNEEKKIEKQLIIRLGSFRGKAKLRINEKGYEPKKTVDICLVNHPVDPLVSNVMRGVMINMFPYPVIENAICKNCVMIRARGLKKYVALPWKDVQIDKLSISKRLSEIEEGIIASKSKNITNQEKAKLILYMLRTIISINLYLHQSLTQIELTKNLKKVKYYDCLRLVSKGVKKDLTETAISSVILKIKKVLINVKEEIGEESKKSIRKCRDAQTYIF
ncbi:MAG: type I-D CRISPR-associated protein Cas5/Csc1 [Candidatus Aenigmarchaeota archaeon]|nr:type I-D CRISPR-associated protein Cas5/Csc1 [Candidatus Aenigmarchaeota archaeon]